MKKIVNSKNRCYNKNDKIGKIERRDIVNNTFVCDFEEVKSLCRSINEKIENFESTIVERQTNVTENLTTNWEGDASTTFTEKLTAQTKKITDISSIAKDLVAFIEKASDEIETLDKSFESYEI